MAFYMYFFVALLTSLHFSLAADPVFEKVWGAVIFTLHGDSALHGLNAPRNLTSLGANQLYDAGNTVRNRYIEAAPEKSGHITAISEGSLIASETEILATTEQAVSASALAFMQGLYPPAAEHNYRPDPPGDSHYVNGSLIHYPLSGYQYPALVTTGTQDPASIHTAGHLSCPAYTENIVHWEESWQGRRIRATTNSFYEDLYDRVLEGAFAKDDVNYYNAPYIFDYLQYEYTHNAAARNIISQDDLDRARYLANEHAYGANANFSAVDFGNQRQNINAISGMTLADYVIRALEQNIQTQGASNKLSLLFGSFEPMVAFSALLGLPSSRQPDFYGRPNPGSSMIIELLSRESNASAPYPESDTDFMVRFLLRNGTGSPSHLPAPLVPYPMFGHSAVQSVIPYKEFLSNLIDLRVSVATWCRLCDSQSVFCAAYDPDGRRRDPGGNDNCVVYQIFVLLMGTFLGLIVCFWLGYLCGYLCECVNCGSKKPRKLRKKTAGRHQRALSNPSALSKQPESFEMSTSGNKSGARNNAHSESIQDLSLGSYDEEDEILISPATEPVLPRDTV